VVHGTSPSWCAVRGQAQREFHPVRVTPDDTLSPCVGKGRSATDQWSPLPWDEDQQPGKGPPDDR
jgi:hypothetical protein